MYLQIVKIVDGEYFVRFVKIVDFKQRVYRWPEKADEGWVTRAQIIKRITPIDLNIRRGTFTFN